MIIIKIIPDIPLLCFERGPSGLQTIVIKYNSNYDHHYLFLLNKIIRDIPPLRFEIGPFGLPLVNNMSRVLFIIYSTMASDLLENYKIFLIKNRFFQNLKSQLLILF